MSTTAILFTKELSNYINIDSNSRPNKISNLGKVNFFIGPNNSGKSRMMRTLFWGQCETILTNSKTKFFQSEANSLLKLLKDNKIDSIDKLGCEFFEDYSEGIVLENAKNATGPKRDFKKAANVRVTFDSIIRYSVTP